MMRCGKIMMEMGEKEATITFWSEVIVIVMREKETTNLFLHSKQKIWIVVCW
jgi:hypothetical protein